MTGHLQRTAWTVMVVSFIVFCSLCALSAYGLYWFLFQNPVPMTVTAKVSRGSLGITGTDLREVVEREQRALDIGNNLVRPNDDESQGVIEIRDPYRDNEFIASVTLIGANSTAALRAAYRPRFEWGLTNYAVEISRASGRMEIVIAPDLSREVILEIFTSQQTRIRLEQAGWYELDISGDTITIKPHGGAALLVSANQSDEYLVRSPSTYLSSDSELRALPPVTNLLENSEFRTRSSFTGIDGEDTRDIPNAPLIWACGNDEDTNPPRGTFSVIPQDGRLALQLLRGGGATTHGATFCQQGLEGDVWRDVSGYSSLSIQASFYIDYQSLPVCGFEGSECPLLLRIGYINRDGDEGEVLYGFYAVPGPATQYPTTCPTCIQRHVGLREKTWYTFDSGNILAAFGPENRPMAISRVRFYASGHEYDLRISRLELLANGTSN